MKTTFINIGIVDYNVTKILFILIKNIKEKFSNSNLKFFVDTNIKNNLNISNNNNFKNTNIKTISKICDIAIIIGGDGIFINIGRKLSLLSAIPIVGINTGKLGFLSDIMPYQINKIINILKGSYISEKRCMITAKLVRNKKIVLSVTSLNEIIISNSKNYSIFELEVFIDNNYSFSQRADGLMFSTPTGSTGYAISAGGPLLYPTLKVISIIPMFSHSLSTKPIIVNSTSIIKIKVNSYNNPIPFLGFDGNIKLKFIYGDIIEITESNHYINILYPIDYNYFRILRKKLNWNKMLF